MDYCFSTIGLGTIWRRYVELKKYLWRSTLFWLPTFFFLHQHSFCKFVFISAKNLKKRTKNKQRGWDKKKRISKFLLPVEIGSLEICEKKKGREESTLQKFQKCSKFLFSILENFPIYHYQWYNIKIASSLRWPNTYSTKIIRVKSGVTPTQLDSLATSCNRSNCATHILIRKKVHSSFKSSLRMSHIWKKNNNKQAKTKSLVK